MARTITIVYDDGREDAVELNAVDYVKAERHFKGALPPVEGTLYAAWRRLRVGGKFDDWLVNVDRIDNDDDEDDEDPLELDQPPAP